MAKKFYTNWQEFETDFKNQDLKHVKLTDQSGNALVSFNAKMNAGKGSLSAKLQEIKKRLSVAEDGIYILVGQHRFGKGVSPIYFYYAKNVNPDIENFKPTMAEPKNNSNNDNLLSLETAVENIKESSNLKAENLFLKKENENYKEQIAELKKTIEELENQVESLQESIETLEDGEVETQNGSLSDIGKLFENIAPALMPLADKYFELKEKKLNFDQAKFLHENGYELPGAKKVKQFTRPRPQTKKEIPQPGQPGWDEFISDLNQLSDEELNQALESFKNYPDLVSAIEQELFEEEEEEEEEEQQTAE
jgi:exonuclease VII small subunit